MNSIVFLNSSRVDFDNKLDFSKLKELGKVTLYEDSRDDQILDSIKGQNIVITKELPIGRELIMKFPSNVKLICEAGTGYNNIEEILEYVMCRATVVKRLLSWLLPLCLV